MRNLKKILALALVFALGFTFTASAADFTDASEIGANYVDDVNMLVELGVIAGYPDGSFGPQKNITRAEFAKMAYTIKYGSDTDGNLFAAQKSNFWDVEGNASVAWAKGYINYCANQNIVSGVGGGKFNPSGNITVAEATKMLLVILGCDPAKEGFTGANWVANVTAKAIDLGIYNGWTGDPSQLATRELVAKLMRNTIFSSVYTYSAITGIGSQMDALGQHDNKTLGEITMGLQTVTGIVVANERYFISTNEKGNPLGDINNDGSVGTGEYAVSTAATGAESGKSLVYYEYYDDENKETRATTMEIDRALDDDMLGAKVNVFFKADKIENNGRIDYKNIEVLGNVLVHSDTVAYTVPAIATDIMPDGDSSSTSEVRPYITFIVDGVEKQIKASSDLPKVQKKVDAQTNTSVTVNYDGSDMTIADAVVAEFTPYAYELNSADIDEDGDLQPAGATFIEEMGAPSLAQYRFVSVDGGNTYSYMFKMVDGTNSGYGSVTSYSEASGTIRLAGDTVINGSYDLEDVVLNGEIATDDVVVAYRANGKVVVDKVDIFNAAVDDFDDEDNAVILAGNKYYKWVECDLDGNSLFFDYYQDNRAAMNAGTKYYAYNNIIMEIESDDEVASVENYAVILRSYYDSALDTAYVKLGFADNTEGTYAIGKLYTKKASDPQASVNNRPQDFDNNAFFGTVVSYKILSDGTVDLSDQNFKDNEFHEYYANGTTIEGSYNENGVYSVSDADGTAKVIGVVDGKISFTGVDGNSKIFYPLNDATILFALYGTPGYVPSEEDPEKIIIDAATDGFLPVKSRAYKLSELKDNNASYIDTLYVNVGGSQEEANEGVGHIILNSKIATNKYVVAASMSVGAKVSGIQYKESNSLGYVVSAKQYYNATTKNYYAKFVLINEDGLIEANTVEDVKDLNSTSVLKSGVVGPIDGEEGGDGVFPQGSFVRFNLNSDGLFDVIDLTGGNKNEKLEVKTKVNPGEQNGLFLVNIVGVRNEVVSFYDTDADVIVRVDGKNLDGTENTSEVAEQADSLSFHEDDGCKIIGIEGDDYANEALTKVSSRVTDLEAGVGNAIIQIEEGQIVRIFSFSEGYSL